MRVVHVIDSGGLYGAEIMLVYLCKAQQKLGLDVEVISIGKKSEPEKAIERKLTTEGIAHKKWRMLALPDFTESLKIMRYCQSTDTHIIHSHGYKGNILLGLLPKSKRHIPLVSTVHGYTSRKRLSKIALYELLDRYALNRMDSVVLVSEGMRHQISDKRLKDRLHIIPNGIPSDTSEKRGDPIEYFSDKDFKIGAMGRLSTEKNFDLLIRAMPNILNEVPNAKLVIYGEGGKRDQLEALVKDLEIQKSAFLPGYLEDPSRLYKDIDVFVNCSLSEGMPITLIEAMKEGCIMVASDIPANRELLLDTPKAGILLPLNHLVFAREISRIRALSSDQIRSAKEEAKRKYINKYTSSSMAKMYLELYSRHVPRDTQFKFDRE